MLMKNNFDNDYNNNKVVPVVKVVFLYQERGCPSKL